MQHFFFFLSFSCKINFGVNIKKPKIEKHGLFSECNALVVTLSSLLVNFVPSFLILVYLFFVIAPFPLNKIVVYFFIYIKKQRLGLGLIVKSRLGF